MFGGHFAFKTRIPGGRISRESLNIRYSLLPYLYTLFYHHYTQVENTSLNSFKNTVYTVQ